MKSHSCIYAVTQTDTNQGTHGTFFMWQKSILFQTHLGTFCRYTTCFSLILATSLRQKITYCILQSPMFVMRKADFEAAIYDSVIRYSHMHVLPWHLKIVCLTYLFVLKVNYQYVLIGHLNICSKNPGKYTQIVAVAQPKMCKFHIDKYYGLFFLAFF